MLMIGVTLSLGGLVSVAAMGQLTLGAGQSSLGASLDLRSAGTLVSLVYAVVPVSGSCPGYMGQGEGTTLVISVYDYGDQGFSPAVITVNATAHEGNYTTVLPGSISTYDVPLGSCAHQTGQSILMAASTGEVFQFET